MKQLNTLFSIFIFYLLFSCQAIAQQNAIGFSVTSFDIPKYNTGVALNTEAGVSYQRKIVKNFYVEASYAQWESFTNCSLFADILINIPDYGFIPGKLIEMRNYKFIDLNPKYDLPVSNARNRICFGLAAFYAWGINTYITQSFVSYTGMEANYLSRQAWTGYFGIAPNISYEFSLIPNRLYAGADLKYRLCLNTDYSLYEFGMHARLGFGDPWGKQHKRKAPIN